MKKILFSMFAMLAIVSAANGADQLKVDKTAYLSTTTTPTSFLVFFNQESKYISGVSFTIKLPAGVEFKSSGSDPAYSMGTTVIGPNVGINYGSEGTDKNVVIVAIGSDTPIKLLESMLIAFQIQAASGSSFTADTELEGGQIYDITFTKNNASVSGDPISFKLKVTDRIVLDENSPYAPPTSGSNKNVLVKRTIKANNWSTICLPFDMSREKLEAAFGSDVQIAEFTKCSYDATDGFAVEFETNDDLITGRTPYLIKVSSTISQFLVDQIKFLKAPESVEQELDNYSEGTGSMEGNYILTKMEENSLFLQDNKFYSSLDGQTIKGFRALFKFVDGDGKAIPIPGKATSRAMFVVDGNPVDDGTTAIRERYASENKRVYSVTGRYMGENVDMKSLPKGIYIVDGVKIIKD